VSKAKGVTTIHGKEPVLKTALCGVEYDSGELYYDRMGRVVRQLHQGGHGWLRDATVAIKQTQVMNPAEGLILTVSTSGAALTLSTEGHPEGIEAEDVARLADQSSFALGVIVDELELANFQRIGYRESYSFACDSLEETEAWIKGLGLVRIDDSLYTTFGNHYAMSWALLFAAEECRYRLELRGAERPASVPVGPGEMTIKHSRAKQLKRDELLQLLTTRRHKQMDPEYAAILDIDAFLWDDTDADFDIRGFVLRRAADNLNLFRRCLPQQGG
jgi:hypothetical protein